MKLIILRQVPSQTKCFCPVLASNLTVKQARNLAVNPANLKKEKPPSDPSSNDSSSSSDSDDKDDGNSDDSGDSSNSVRSRKKKKIKPEKKRKLKRSNKKKHRSSSSDTNSGSDGVSSINSGDSMGTMENKAKKMIRRYEAELLKNPGQYTLKSFNEEIKDVIKRLVNHDHLGDIVSTLVNLKRKITKQVDDLDKRDRESRQMPKSILPSWDGNQSTYLTFKAAITNVLCYDNQYLNISTLINQIKGTEKGKITNMLQNVNSLREI